MADLPRFDLGQAGVVLTSSPLHGDPAQLTKGQNIEFLRVSGLGGVGTRGPIQPFTTSIMKEQDGVTPGSVLAACEVPLPSPADFIPTPYLITFTLTGFDFSLNDGSTWTSQATGHNAGGLALPIAFGNKIYYRTGGGGMASTDTSGNTSQIDPGPISSMILIGKRIYFAVVDNGVDAGNWDGIAADPAAVTLTGRVKEYDPATGITRQCGQNFGIPVAGVTLGASGSDLSNVTPVGHSTMPAGHLGIAPAVLTTTTGSDLQLICEGTLFLTASVSGPGSGAYFTAYQIEMLNPHTDAAWTIPLTHGGTLGNTVAGSSSSWNGWGRPFSLAQLSPLSLMTSTLSIAARDAAVGSLGAQMSLFSPASTDVATESPNPGAEWFMGAIVFGTNTFYAYASADAPPDFGTPTTPSRIRIRRIVTGASLSTAVDDLDVIGTYGGVVLPGVPFVSADGLRLYWPMYGLAGHTSQGYLLQRTIPGVWTQARTNVNLSAQALAAIVEIPI